jgi:hypothetical protein
MSECDSVLHEEHQWIERAEPHGTRQVLDRLILIAKTGSQASAGGPSDR